MLAALLCGLDIDLLDSLQMSTSVLYCSKSSLVRGRLLLNPDYRRVRGCFRGQTFSA